MSQSAQTIAADWMFALRSACQTFYCATMEAERWQFETALVRLARSVPAPSSPHETEALRDRLKIAAVEGASIFHQAHHRRAGQPHVLARRWSRRCSCGDGPPATRACSSRSGARRFSRASMRAIRRRQQRKRLRFCENPSVSRRTSNGSLEKWPRREPACGEASVSGSPCRWGSTGPGSACDGLSRRSGKPGTNAERAAAAAGYASYHSVVGALRTRTGLTPTEIRQLPPARFDEVLHVQLSLASGERKPLLPIAAPPTAPTAVPPGFEATP